MMATTTSIQLRRTIWRYNSMNFIRTFSSRHTGICMHPDSISNLILPGNRVERTNKDGLTSLRYVEIEHGYFWMIKDLNKSNNKPMIPTEISSETAMVFPTLTSVKSLSGKTVNLPEHLLRKNRSKDSKAHCTLVAICYREFGRQQLDSWVNPFRKAFVGKDRVETIRINMSEGWFARWMLQSLIVVESRRSTPVEDHDTTFMFFGETERFRDDLRMHNLMSGYVFLLDGQGKVRFAASGEATESEADQLIQTARKLTLGLGERAPIYKRTKVRRG